MVKDKPMACFCYRPDGDCAKCMTGLLPEDTNHSFEGRN